MAKKKVQSDNNENEDLDSKTTLTLKDLPGIGDATIKKLQDAGIVSIRALAMIPLSKIEEAGIGEKTTLKIVKAAQDVEKMGFKSADKIWEKRKTLRKLTTGSEHLDELLGGGFETGAVTELFGEYRTGKIQIAHQSCVNVQLSYEEGGLEGAALYIDSEGTFRPERIIQMSEAKNLDWKNKILKNITIGRAYNSDHQILLVKEAPKIIDDKNIKLVVVDSIITHFRSEYIGRGTLASRQQILNTHIHDLLRLTDTYDELAVIFTNQVSAKPDVFYGNPITHTGGHIIAHGSTIRIYLRKGKGEQRVAKVVDAPHLPEEDAIFSITEDGIRD